MKERKVKYVQTSIKRCVAKIRPSYCFYEGNPCCFSCDKNTECMEVALRDRLMKPCRVNIPVQMKDGTLESVNLFDQTDLCEFSI